jgi:hypothetical protein
MYVSQAESVTIADPVQDDRPGYIVRGPYTLTVVRSFLVSLAYEHQANWLLQAMITDLKRDTIDWWEERSRTDNRG